MLLVLKSTIESCIHVKIWSEWKIDEKVARYCASRFCKHEFKDSGAVPYSSIPIWPSNLVHMKFWQWSRVNRLLSVPFKCWQGMNVFLEFGCRDLFTVNNIIVPQFVGQKQRSTRDEGFTHLRCQFLFYY